jgi:hypothetical protein
MLATIRCTFNRPSSLNGKCWRTKERLVSKQSPLMAFVARTLIIIGLFSGWQPFNLARAQQPASDDLKIEIIHGDNVTNNAKKRVAQPLVVEVHDRNNRPVAGALVVFALPTNGASATFAGGSKVLSLTTDQAGRVTASGMKANSTAGSFKINVTASSNGRTATTTITNTNVLTATTIAGLSVGAAVAIGAAVAAAVAVTAYKLTSGSGKAAQVSVGTPKLP